LSDRGLSPEYIHEELEKEFLALKGHDVLAGNYLFKKIFNI